MKSYQTFKRQLLKNKRTRQAYEELEKEFRLIEIIIEKRIERGMTQTELAKKIGTKQSAIARLESGSYNPSILFLERVAKALNSELTISLS